MTKHEEHRHKHTHIGDKGHSHNHLHVHASDENILTAFLLNLGFVVVEIIGGLLTNSIAILSDAIHDLGDSAAIGCAYFLERLSKKGADEKYTYGYRRYSLVSALVTAMILIAGSVLIIYSSAKRIFNPEEVHAQWMLAVAVLGVIVNGIAALKTSHGHGANERVISLHMLEDVLGWVVVLVGSACIWLFDLPIIDPILSLCVALFILWQALKNVKDVMLVLLERVPPGFDLKEYRNVLAATPNVLEIHHLHIWSLDGECAMATMHAVVPGGMTARELDEVRSNLLKAGERFGVEHLTVQMESSRQCGEQACTEKSCVGCQKAKTHSHGDCHEHEPCSSEDSCEHSSEHGCCSN